jgi:hypothetical protein
VKRLPLFSAAALVLALFVAGGCSSNEPEGFASGDKEGLGFGIPEPAKPATPAASDPAKADPAKTDPAKSTPGASGGAPLPDEAQPTTGEAKGALGYTPDADGKQSGQPTTP